MKILLDTQAFLWFVSEIGKAGRKARAAWTDPDNEFYLSIASIWELAIKVSIGKLRIAEPLERLVPQQLLLNNVQQLDIAFRHVVNVATMPLHHRDPFDRLIASQALVERMPILSPDKMFDAYGVTRLW